MSAGVIKIILYWVCQFLVGLPNVRWFAECMLGSANALWVQ